ncbi:glycosyltransferase family 1 protein [Novosphingobium sp. RD2P27]|uniref:Glycosyltransferase family 1 protein n=1 Tax=Novosphingobium kalidii TaxID=3230299 RepID=A0ABV2CZ70_9SPHN
MDRLIQSDPNHLGRHKWRLLIPNGADTDLQLGAITVEAVGRHSGHLWEQTDLARVAAGTRLLNLGNSGPLLHRDKLVIIHDAAVFRTPANFSWQYRVAHSALGRGLARTGKVGTVSEFSRRELAHVLGMREEAIVVASNGCDHFVDRSRDERILSALGLEQGRYFLFVGSPAPNKNLGVLLEAFARLDRPGAKLVIAGSLDRSVFSGMGAASGEGVIVAPGRNDAEVGALYAHATAHVFPSLYEGFGIPPLEAMASGCRVIASDIPVVREVCGEGATYFPPRDAQVLADVMRRHWDDPQMGAGLRCAAAARVAHFRWQDSARGLMEALLAP